MNELIKLVIFFVVLSSIALLGYWSFKKLNQRIITSENVVSLIFYSLILIATNFILLFGGIFILVKAYDFLSSSGT